MDNWGDILERLRLGGSGDGWEEGWTGAAAFCGGMRAGAAGRRFKRW